MKYQFCDILNIFINLIFFFNQSAIKNIEPANVPVLWLTKENERVNSKGITRPSATIGMQMILFSNKNPTQNSGQRFDIVILDKCKDKKEN